MKIFYAVTPKHSAVTRFADEGYYKRVYDLVKQITDNHELAEEASSWCQLASVGEVFDSDLFKVEIIEDVE